MTIEQQIAAIAAKIRAREGNAGFKANVEALKTRKAELEAQRDNA